MTTNKPNPKEALTFFCTKKDFRLYFIKDRRILPFNDMCIDDLSFLMSYMENDGNVMDVFLLLNITTPMEQLRIWISCNFSTIQSTPDFIDGKRINYSSTPCQFKDDNTCVFNCAICQSGQMNLPYVPGGYLEIPERLN